MLLRLPEKCLKIFLWFTAILLCLSVQPAAVAQTTSSSTILTAVPPSIEATVSSYAELLQAVNEDGATDITIAADYKHGTAGVGESLKPTGSIVIHPAQEGEITLVGRFDVASGEISFERINLQGEAAVSALWVGGDAVVSVLDVTGGSSIQAMGGCGVEAEGNARVMVRKAIGGDGKTFGGDGIYASNHATVYAEYAEGGNSSSGYAGDGVVCFQAEVEVQGDACGGNGALSGGHGILLGLDASVSVAGAAVDGSKLGKRKLPESPAVYADLLYALRSGEHDIVLSAKYKHGNSQKWDKPWFVTDGETVVISGGSKSKNAALKNRVNLNGGSFVLQGVNITGVKNEAAVRLAGDAVLTIEGNITATGEGASLLTEDASEVNMTGTLTGMAIVTDESKLNVTGSLKKGKQNVCLLAQDHAAAAVTGDCNGMIVAAGESFVSVDGQVKVSANVNAVVAHDYGQVYVHGDVQSSASASPALLADGNGMLSVHGNVTGSKKTNAILAKENSAVQVTGNVIGGTEGTALPTIWQHGNRVAVNGTVSGATYTQAE